MSHVARKTEQDTVRLGIPCDNSILGKNKKLVTTIVGASRLPRGLQTRHDWRRSAKHQSPEAPPLSTDYAWHAQLALFGVLRETADHPGMCCGIARHHATGTGKPRVHENEWTKQ